MKLSDILAKAYSFPQELFFDLWDCASSFTTFQRTTAEVCEKLVEKLLLSLELDDESAVVYATLAILAKELGGTRQKEHGAIMALLRAFDDIFLRIHPRARSKGANAANIVVPVWLRQAELKRLRCGIYWESSERVLIPRGPLLRVSRKQFSAGGETIEDYFSAIVLAPKKTALNHRTITVQILVVPLGGRRGVSVRNTGGESVVFVPTVVEPADLTVTGELIGSQGFISSTSNVDAANIIGEVLKKADEVDLLIAPEMAVDQLAAKRLSQVLKMSVNAPRLTVAGTGNTVDVDVDGLSWNESAVLNEFGHFLWRQRKMWTSGFSNERAQSYGFPSSPSGYYLEKNAEANEIVIADVDGFGRCCILICQDLQTKPLAVEIIKAFQPDWIFCPILDPGVKTGGWAHQRTFDLSSDSNARFVVASSASLVARPADQIPPIGLAVGPKASIVEENDKGRTYVEASVDLTVTPCYVKVIWDGKNWSQTKVVSTDVSAPTGTLPLLH